MVVVFAAFRGTTDVENISSGVELADTDFDKRYADNPVLAYAHILPGLIYLTVAPSQIVRSIRRGRIDLHRRVGRVLVIAGLSSGVLGIALGVLIPYGGFAETSATTVFGVYFVGALILAYRSIRARDVAAHRAWMIRAFAIGTGVGTTRLVIISFEVLGLATFDEIFGPSFWIAFVLHALLAEAWLRGTPTHA